MHVCATILLDLTFFLLADVRVLVRGYLVLQCTFSFQEWNETSL